MTSNYTVGDAIRLSLEVRDVVGTLADPTAISLTVKPPESPSEMPSGDIVKDAVGKYHCDLSLIKSGSWAFRFQTSGQNQAVTEGSIYVYPQQVV